MSAPDDADCRALWLSVIRLAIEDRDRGWFDLANGDFRAVCWLAGVDPEYALRAAEAQLDEPNRRRNPIISQRGQGRAVA